MHGQRGVDRTGEAGPPSGRAFGALRHRDFQLFWGGAVIAHIAGWMQQLAQAWLVYALTGNALLVGLNGLFSSLPFILVSFYAGTLIDRVDRRRLLIWIELGNAVASFAVAILIAIGWIELWQIYLSGAIHGLLGAFESPARGALLPHLVPRSDLMTAVSLQSIQRKGAQIIGPALGGVFLAAFGVAGSFFIRAASFLLVMASIGLIRVTNPTDARSHEAPVQAMLEGFRYVQSQPVIGGLILMECAISIFGSYTAMMVIFAREVFETGPEGLGLLQSAAGFGSVAGSLVLASLGDIRRKGLLLMATGVTYALALLAFSFTPWFGAAVVLLMVVGVVDIVFGAVRQTMIQLQTREEMLGRVMSLTGISQRGLGNFGGFFAGGLTAAVGSVQVATALGALITLVVMVGVLGRIAPIRNYVGTGTGPGPRRRSSSAAVS